MNWFVIQRWDYFLQACGTQCSHFDCLNHHFENYCYIMIFIIIIFHQPHGLTKILKQIYEHKDTPVHIKHLIYSFPSLCYSLLPCKTGARNSLIISPFQELKLPTAISQSIFDPGGSAKELSGHKKRKNTSATRLNRYLSNPDRCRSAKLVLETPQGFSSPRP